MTFTCYQTVLLTIVHGIFNGITIEGGSRWGYDPVWEKNTEEDEAKLTDRHTVQIANKSFSLVQGTEVNTNLS